MRARLFGAPIFCYCSYMEDRKLSLAIRAEGSREKASLYMRFFKTGPGQYGEGDRFLGVTVPRVRDLVRAHPLSLTEAVRLLGSAYHEERLAALITLTHLYEKGDEKVRRAVVREYCTNTPYINNWDLVDVSAHKILGVWALEHEDGVRIMRRFVRSKNMWERRIAIIASFAFLRRGERALTEEFACTVLSDTHDLMHKAVGWALREMGKHCGRNTLSAFLKAHVHEMPRTSLRYAIEHYSARERAAFLRRPRG